MEKLMRTEVMRARVKDVDSGESFDLIAYEVTQGTLVAPELNIENGDVVSAVEGNKYRFHCYASGRTYELLGN